MTATTRATDPNATIDEMIAESWAILDRIAEQHYRNGWMRPESAEKWRLSERRRAAIAAGTIEVAERDTLAAVVSLDERRSLRRHAPESAS